MKNSVIDYFLSLVKIDSESRNELNVAMKVKKDLEEIGAKVYFDDADKQTNGNVGNLYAFISGDNSLEPVLLCAHLDTVVPGNNVKPVIKDGFIYSDGTTILGADDKSGIAQIICGIKEYQKTGKTHPPIEILFTVCEEVGLLGAKAFDTSLIKSKRCYAFDSHGVGSVMIGAPSQNGLSITVRGKKAHAGVEPEKGISAIVVASEAIFKSPLGRIDKETTSNIGVIQGGAATNIVTDLVELKGEVRSHSEDKLNKITDEICETFKETAAKYKIDDFTASVDIEVTCSYKSFYSDESEKIVKDAIETSTLVGLDPRVYKGGGGSDANVLNEKGIKSIVIGTGMNNVHTTEENIAISSLELGTKWVKELLGVLSRG